MCRATLAAIVFFLASGVAFADSRHYEAQNCEIYVEKIHLQKNSYDSVSANFYIKVTNAHLDGPVREVGMRGQALTRLSNGQVILDEWRNQVAARVNPFGGGDLWRLTLLLDAGDLHKSYEGALYVVTERETWYWLHPMNDGRRNFHLRMDTFHIDNETVWDELWVNDYPRYADFNPKRCE